MSVERFEDLLAWQKAKDLARLVYEVTRRGPIIRDQGFSGQLQRAAVSMMSNIAEGYERGSRVDFHRFLTIAKASCAEVRLLLYLAHEIGYLDRSEFQRTMHCANEAARVLGGLRAKIGQQIAERRTPR